jgi:hypothetical protein
MYNEKFRCVVLYREASMNVILMIIQLRDGFVLITSTCTDCRYLAICRHNHEVTSHSMEFF